MTKFEIDADYLLAETPVDALFTIRNAGTADAGAFKVAILETNNDDGVKGTSDALAVDKLAAGNSLKGKISLSLPKAGHWTLAATADTDDAVDESNEKDNARDIDVKVVSGLPDLQWANGDGFSFTASQTKPGYYDVAYDFINKGTADAAGEVAFIGVTWYRDEDSASGNFPDVGITDLAVGEERVLEQSLQMPGPGSYTIYAFLDKDHVVDELNEDNNEASLKLTVP